MTRSRCLLGLIVVLIAGVPIAETAIARTYYIKKGKRSWTRMGRKLYFKAKRPKRRLRLVQLTSSEGFFVANPKRAWGTRLAVYRINITMAKYHQQFPNAPAVEVRDLSRRYGGPMNNHMTHMWGRDVDFPLILDRGYKPVKMNLRRTWFLIKAFADSCDVDVIFLDRALQAKLHSYAKGLGVEAEALKYILQYPAASRTRKGIVRHWPNHADHLHVRFRDEKVPLLKVAKAYCDWRKNRESVTAN